MTDELKPLSKKHQRVLDEYLVCFKQVAAYQKVYPNAGYDSAKAASTRLFTDDNFAAHLQSRLDEVHMGANEALKLLADMARGDIGEFMETTTMGFELDIDAAKKSGRTKLIKKIKQRTEIFSSKKGDEDREVHTQEIELYSAKEALDTILKVGGKLKDTELTISVNITDD
jgi:phage terminase small subunit